MYFEVLTVKQMLWQLCSISGEV